MLGAFRRGEPRLAEQFLRCYSSTSTEVGQGLVEIRDYTIKPVRLERGIVSARSVFDG